MTFGRIPVESIEGLEEVVRRMIDDRYREGVEGVEGVVRRMVEDEVKYLRDDLTELRDDLTSASIVRDRRDDALADQIRRVEREATRERW